ncbi:MAG: cupin domain-containing protein [Bacteroidetes bacterium]|nr:MAG: cupin domain-containing protein [Bacteroidota bacterium]
MYFHAFESIAPKEIAPGFLCQLIHTEHNTINFLDVAAGSTLPLHQHPHHQSSFVLQGEFEMTVGGTTQVLTPQNYCLIPGGVMHGGKALTNCKILDVFSPIRQDYR